MNLVKQKIDLQKIYDNQCKYYQFCEFCDIKTKMSMITLPPFYKELLEKNRCNSFKSTHWYSVTVSEKKTGSLDVSE